MFILLKWALYNKKPFLGIPKKGFLLYKLSKNSITFVLLLQQYNRGSFSLYFLERFL